MRDYDPDKRFNGSVRLPHQAYNKIRVNFIFYTRFVLWPMLLILNKLKPTIFLILMLMDLKLSTKIKLKLKNGAKNTIFFSLQIQSPSKLPNFSVTSQLNWVNSQLLLLKDKNQFLKLTKLNTQLNSNPKKLHVQVLLSVMSKQVNKTLDKTSLWLLTSQYL